ncbi:2Fe-2S iron-sulfur cluster-binding protein [Pseudanabaena sp. PCC 6802]|uniref:2Fe-2S iron-sulfur cluster-binding protein n=1 Tax=Pseudanabaena sp. PCC 6802 TaxID=118173 RepID=UPI00034BE3E5|nr:2Fe-2S iron-sulfur cluster-binding protein [Pseudanabaena sp. PCC 6802]
MTKSNRTEEKSHTVSSADARHNAATLRIVLAESNPAIHQRLLKTIEGIGKWIVYPCSEYTELVQTLSSGAADLLILGNVDNGSCFEIFQLCNKEWDKLPVILVSHEVVIPEFYRHALAESKGLGGVVSSDPINHNELVRVIQNVTGVIRAQKQAQSLNFPSVKDVDTFVPLQIDSQLTTAATGEQLLNVLLSNKVNVLKACGGNGRCATCHVFVKEGMDALSPPTQQERLTLSLMRIEQSNARLACQCKVLDRGVVLEVPKGKYVNSEAELESLVGKKAQQSLVHPFTGEVLVQEGKLILRTALEKMQELNREFEKEMGVLLSLHEGI